jgi:hypothetical protein
MNRPQAFDLLLTEARNELSECDLAIERLRKQAAEVLRRRDDLLVTISVIQRLSKKGVR